MYGHWHKGTVMESQQAIVDFNWFCQIWMLMPQSLFGYTLWLVRLNFITQFPEKRKSSLPFLSWIFADILSNQKLYFVAFKGYMPTYLLFSPYFFVCLWCKIYVDDDVLRYLTWLKRGRIEDISYSHCCCPSNWRRISSIFKMPMPNNERKVDEESKKYPTNWKRPDFCWLLINHVLYIYMAFEYPRRQLWILWQLIFSVIGSFYLFGLLVVELVYTMQYI